MSLRFDLSGYVAGNDILVEFNLTYAGIPLNVTGYTLKAYLKAASTTPDALATVYQSGTGLTIVDASIGEFTWEIPVAVTSISAPGALWYRVDVLDSSSHPATAMYGALNLTAA